MYPWASGEPARSAGNAAGNGDVLADKVLLGICRVEESDPQVTPAWLSKLRLVPRLVGQSCVRPGPQLESALTLLASVLGRLKQFNPTHLPFGYHGPQIQSRGWVERGALERIGKQVVGLMWHDATAHTVAAAVQRAVTEGIRLGFLEQRRYDAWRPGMRSGSGWRSAVTATPYGVMKACSAADSCRPQDEPPATPDVTNVDPSEAPTDAAAHGVSGAGAGAGNAQSTAAIPDPKSVDGPAVQLGRPGEPCVVLGKQKRPLTDGQHAVLSALIKAGDEGMTKDQIELVRPSARRILKKLRGDADWAEVVLMPGQTNGRYRIKA